MPLYALNLSRRSPEAVARHGGRVVALVRLDEALSGDAEPRRVMIVVEWPWREAFRAFLEDPELWDLRPLLSSSDRVRPRGLAPSLF
jgi:uncharacterized protein (DUF1330 family)